MKTKLRYIKQLFRCIVQLNYKNLFATVRTAHRVSGKSSVFLFFDIVFCGFKYGAAHSDYLLCEFYKLTAAQRATYVTRAVNNTITSLMNDKEYYHYFDNKDEFYTCFAEFLGREWLPLDRSSREEFDDFMRDRETVIIKPCDGACGAGVEKLKKSDFASLDEMYTYVKKSPNMIIEELIIQHPELDRMNPGSVNTLRVVTIFSEGEAHIVYAFIRIGNSDRPVDNINAGGMCAPIDLDSGLITHPGYDKNRQVYDRHPRTGCEIVGFRIPMWDTAKDVCLRAAAKMPEMGYVGWDVAVTPDGPVLVEGNNLPGHDILQMPPHVPDRIGMLPRFKMFVKGL